MLIHVRGHIENTCNQPHPNNKDRKCANILHIFVSRVLKMRVVQDRCSDASTYVQIEIRVTTKMENFLRIENACTLSFLTRMHLPSDAIFEKGVAPPEVWASYDVCSKLLYNLCLSIQCQEKRKAEDSTSHSTCSVHFEGQWI